MKKTLTMLACAALVAPAFAGEAITEPITITLPGSVTPGTGFEWEKNMSTFVETYKTVTDAGYHVGVNNGTTLGNAGVNNEGKLVTSSDNVASVTLLGRTMADGDTFVMVIKDTALTGKVVNALTLTGSGSSDNTLGMGGNFYVVVYENNDLVGSATSHLNAVNSDDIVTTTLSLPNITFTDNHRIAIAFMGGKGTGTTAYTINNIKLTAAPEPATATLSLLALAGLASRRRRH